MRKRRQLRAAVPAERRPRRQHHGPVLQVRRRQHQRELPRLGLERARRRRHADQRDDSGRTRRCAGTISSLNNGTSGLRRRVRRDQPLRVGGDALDRLRLRLASERRLDAALRRSATPRPKATPTSQPFVEFGAPATFTYDLRGRAPQVTFATSIRRIRTTCSSTSASLHQILNDDEREVRLPRRRRRRSDGACSKSIKFGAKFTDHERELVFNATTYGGFHVPMNCNRLQRRPCSSRFAGGPTPGDFLDEISAPGTLTRYWQINKDAVDDILFDNLHGGRMPYPQQSFSVTEKANAGYVMGNLGGDKWRGNVGVRYRDAPTRPRTATRSACRSAIAESVRRLHAAQRRPPLRRLAAERELRLRSQRPVRACVLAAAQGHGAAGLHGRRAAREPEPRRADRHRRQSEHRSVSREPGRTCRSSGTRPGRGVRAGDLLQGHQVVHHGRP